MESKRRCFTIRSKSLKFCDCFSFNCIEPCTISKDKSVLFLKTDLWIILIHVMLGLDYKIQLQTGWIYYLLLQHQIMKGKLYKIRNVPRNASTSEENIRSGEFTVNPSPAALNSINETIDKDHQFSQLVSMFQTFIRTAQSNDSHSTKSYQVEARDREVLIPIPAIIDNKIPQSQLKSWISTVVKTICSTAFNYFFKKEMNYQQAKIYCSENIFKNIVVLGSNYTISATEIELIDSHIKKGVLTYLGTKYPLTDSTQINKKLQEAVHEVDNIQALSNNYFNTTSLIFQYRQSGNYNDLIMRMLNDLMGIIDAENQEEKTNYQQFEEFMSTIFQKVEDEDWMRKQDRDHMVAHQLKLTHQHSEISSRHIQEIEAMNKEEADDIKERLRRRAQEKDKYKSKVKEYTHYLIGRKIPENTPTYSENQIQNGNISIKSPTILRILTKWCGQLHEKYSNNYFSNRSESVKVQRGSNVNSLLAWMRKKIDQKLQSELGTINEAMTDLFKNNYEMQSKILQHELNLKGDQFIDQVEKASGKLSYKVVKNLHTYIIAYLNKLIHGLLKASKEFFDEANIFDYSLWPSPPNLLTFKIGDLMRCKCSSKQKEILRIYKQLQRISRENPQKLKIIRIKDRLRSGTNDILINIRFNNQITCQIQLAIKSKVSDFIKCSNLFHHYLYQLERSVFGPLTEFCSIWNSLDRRTDIYRELVEEEEFAAAPTSLSEHSCPKLKKRFELKELDKPFQCSHCLRTYHHNNYLKTHVKCSLCAYMLCANCRIDKDSESQLKNTLISSPELRQACKQRIGKDKGIPQLGVCVFIESKEPKEQLFTLVTYQKTKYLLGKREGGQIYEIYNISSKKMMKNFRKKFIVFEVCENQLFKKIQQKQAINKYILPLIMRENFKKEKQSINLMDLKLTTEECQQILSVGTRSQKENVKNLFLVDNQIQRIPFNPEEFPNIRWLTLSRNVMQSFEGFEKLKNLKNIIFVSGQLTQFPPQLYQCTSLEYLSLPNNSISSIDDHIINLSRLLYLELSNNNLTSLPDNLYECTTLVTLKMDGNRLGIIQDKISKLKNLEVLIYSSNELTSVSEQIGELTKLRQIYLSRNDTLTTLPDTFAKLQNIAMLDISSTAISSIPVHPEGWPNLKLFNIEASKVQKLPSLQASQKFQILIVNSVLNFEFTEDCNLKGIKSLQAKNNGLTTIPECISKMANVQTLNLQGNPFERNLQIPLLNTLENLYIDYCSLSEVCQLSHLRKLKKLNLSSNTYLSSLPSEKMELPLLEEFVCTSCNLTQLPSSMLKWQKLIKLDIKYNSIGPNLFDEETEAKILNEKICWPNLKYAYLSNNVLEAFPEIILNSPQLLDLHISTNKLTVIPAAIKNLTLLRQIQMNYNEVQVLPEEFGELANMSGAYLSCNKFTKVPLFIQYMKKLQHFYMDYMNITQVECTDWVLSTEGIILGNLKEVARTLKEQKETPAAPQPSNEEQHIENADIQLEERVVNQTNENASDSVPP